MAYDLLIFYVAVFAHYVHNENKLMGKAAANFVCIILLTSVKWSMYGHKKSPLCHEH